MKVKIGRYFNRDIPRIDITIDPDDAISMDYTLAHIILPVLIQHRNSHHGIPGDFSTAGGELYDSQESFDFYKDTYDEAFAVCCERWIDVLDKMIWSFAQLIQYDEYSDKYFHITETGAKWHDEAGQQLHDARIQEGFELFGKYYRALWD